MNTEDLFQGRLKVTRTLLKSVQKTIDNPDRSVADNLAEGDKKSRQLAALLVSFGATISHTSQSLIADESASIGKSVALGTGLAAGVVAGILGGPIVWGSGLLAVLYVWIRKYIEKRQANKKARLPKEKKQRIVKGQKAYEEKVALLKTIIEKMQAIIDKLNTENQENLERIRNLEEALRMMQETKECVEVDFEVS